MTVQQHILPYSIHMVFLFFFAYRVYILMHILFHCNLEWNMSLPPPTHHLTSTSTTYTYPQRERKSDIELNQHICIQVMKNNEQLDLKSPGLICPDFFFLILILRNEDQATGSYKSHNAINSTVLSDPSESLLKEQQQIFLEIHFLAENQTNRLIVLSQLSVQFKFTASCWLAQLIIKTGIRRGNG